MGRRHIRKDYSLSGVYHITISVNHDLRQPLGKVVGNAKEPDGSPDAQRVVLTEVGQMVEKELTSSISRHYPMIGVQDYVIMPEHLHAIVVVKSTIVSANGLQTHLGQVIAGFKKGCNRRFWEITGLRGEPAGARWANSEHAAARDPRLAVHPQRSKLVPSEGTTGRPPLFAQGYVDVMPVKEGLLEQQRKYIHDNPRSRLLRTENRSQLQSQRTGIKTALSLKALLRYLQQECHPSQLNVEQWESLRERLLAENEMIVCDSYGSVDITKKQMLPVVCHRKDVKQWKQQKEACLRAAERGIVLVSPRIAKGEQAIIDEVLAKGYPAIVIVDNGFPEIYHPSQEKMNLCLEKHLLLLSPWKYRYRLAAEGISVAECKTMNCVAQALCRKRDDWWKEESTAG